MKLFKNTSLVSGKAFSLHFSFFYRPVALLCGSKKASIGMKIQFPVPQQAFLTNFIN